MEIIEKIINNLFNRESFVIFFGGFAGAFFAYCFFRLGERKKKKEKSLFIHSEIMKYLGEVRLCIELNVKHAEDIAVQTANDVNVREFV